MKKTILLFVALITGLLMQAQTAAGFNFKALLANNGTPVANQLISVKVSIFQGSSLKWREIHSNVHTDANGIFSIVIGEGTRDAGVASFDLVDWNNTTMKYKVEVDSGSGYTTLVNNEYFKRVPYAKLAENVGQLNKLGVGEMPTQYETVRFKRSNPNSLDDVLDLEMNAAPSSGTAQFIECNVGSNHGVFKVDHNGDITTKGELHGNDSGDADMKAYIYGYIHGSGGNIIPDASSGGFTLSKLAVGHYRVTFNNSPGGYNKYITVATVEGSTNAQRIINVFQHTDYVDFYIKDYSTNNLVDSYFTFVVFKK